MDNSLRREPKERRSAKEESGNVAACCRKMQARGRKSTRCGFGSRAKGPQRGKRRESGGVIRRVSMAVFGMADGKTRVFHGFHRSYYYY